MLLRRSPWTRFFLCCAACTLQPLVAQSIRLTSSSFHPNSLLGNTAITLSASPSSVAFALVSQSHAAANGSIAITVSLTNPANTTIHVYGFFVSASAALTGSASSAAIPSSCVFGLVPTGVPTSYTAFTQTNSLGAAGAGLELISLTGLTTDYAQTDNLTLKIDLTTLPHLPADTYIGTMYLQAQAF